MTETDPLKKHARITGDDRAKISAELVKKYKAGASIRALATEYGRSYGFTHRVLTENDVPLRSRGGGNRRTKTKR
jgi:hypothetical protein